MATSCHEAADRVSLDVEVGASFVAPEWRQRTKGDSVWLPAALLAALVLLSSALHAFGSETQLRWQRPKIAESKPRVAQHTPVLRETPRSSHTTEQRKVRPVAFTQEEGWAVSGVTTAGGQSELESVVVRRTDSFRTAQAPGSPFDDDPLGREIERPYGLPENGMEPSGAETLPPPGMQAPAMDDMFTEEDPTLQPGFDDRRGEPTIDRFERQPEQREPSTFEQDRSLDNRARSPQADPVRGSGSAVTEEERQHANESCAEELENIKSNRIASIDLTITPRGEAGRDFPFECSIDDGSVYAGRHWDEVTYMWKAAANCHKPLYFEQVQLERYGHSFGPHLQPVVSGAHFFGSLIVLPYQMGLTPPTECMYPLGHYRPGNCAPYMVPAVPLSWRAAMFQGGAAVGITAILP